MARKNVVTPQNHAQDIEKYVKFGTSIGIATQLYSTRMEQRLSEFGLTGAQFSILNHLARRMPDGQGITAIAAAVEVRQPAVSKVVAKFEALGWVSFHAAQGDARAKTVRLTQSGGAHLRDVQKSLLPDYTAMLEGWSDEDIAQLTALLFRLTGWLDANRL